MFYECIKLANPYAFYAANYAGLNEPLEFKSTQVAC